MGGDPHDTFHHPRATLCMQELAELNDRLRQVLDEEGYSYEGSNVRGKDLLHYGSHENA